MLPKPQGLADVQRAAQAVDALGGAAVPLARAGRDPRRAARGVRDRRAPAHRVAVLRPDGLRLGAPRRDSAERDGRRRPVRPPAGGARQAGDRRRLPRCGQGAVALRGDRVQGRQARCRPRPRRPAGDSATRACGASTRRRSGPSSTPSRRPRPRSTWPSRSSPRRRPRTGRRCATATCLHDRASYRYFWQVIERAHRTSFHGGPQLPAELRQAWFH